MANEFQVKMNIWGLDQLIAQVGPRLRQVVKVGAFQVEAKAKEFQTPHVDTGATRASIYVHIAGGQNGYRSAAIAIATLNPTAQTTPPHSPPGNDGLSATIGPATDYALPLEFRFPFMRPALEYSRRSFDEAVKKTLAEAARV